MEIIASTYSRSPTKQGPPPFIACGVSALPEWSASHPTDTLLCISAVGAKRVQKRSKRRVRRERSTCEGTLEGNLEERKNCQGRTALDRGTERLSDVSFFFGPAAKNSSAYIRR